MKNSGFIDMKKKNKKRRSGKLKRNKYLPTELWMEVFARSPVKTLLRFRSVSKLWCSLIDARDFTSLHRRLYNCVKPQYIVMEKLGSRIRFTLRCANTFRKTAQLLETTKQYECFATYDGLLLLVRYTSTKVRIWNPSIRKCLKLTKFRHLSTLGLYCIGFCNLVNDYKLFCLEPLSPPVCYCLSYKFSDNKWNRRKIPWKFQFRLKRDPFVVCSAPYMTQGAAHWMICDLNLCTQGNKFTHCISFDIGLKQFYAVKLPENDEMCMWIFTLGHSLALFGFSPLNWRIWVMEKDGDERLWKLTYSGSFRSHAYELLSGYKFTDKFIFEESSGTIFLLSPYGKRKGLICYNLKTHQIQHFGKSIRHFIPYLDSHVESLVLFRGPQSQTLTTFP